MKSIATSIALSSVIATSSFGGSIDLGVSSRVNSTGLFAAQQDAHYPEYRYQSIFVPLSQGGLNFVYKDNGFRLDWNNAPTIEKLKVDLRPYTYGVDRPQDGDRAGRLYVNGWINNADRSSFLVIGSRLANDYRPDWAKPILDQSPVLFVQGGETLQIGNPNTTTHGITFDYSKVEHPNDYLYDITTPDAKVKLDIRGTFVGNIKLVHKDGVALNSSDPAGSFLLWANVEGTLKSTVRLENKTEQITADYNPVKTHNLVSKYAGRDSAAINRLYINGFANGTSGNPLRIISEKGTATYIEFGNNVRGGRELSIVANGVNSYGNKARLTPTLVKTNNSNIHLGQLVATNSGTIIADMNGGEIGDIGFGNWYTDGVHNPTSGGAIILQTSGTLKFTGSVVTNDTANDIVLVDRGGRDTVFDMRSSLNNARWAFLVGQNTTIRLGGQTNLINTLGSGDTRASNTKIIFDKTDRQNLLRIGNGSNGNGLDYSVAENGLTIESNVNRNHADIVAIQNTVSYRDMKRSITLIPKVTSADNYKEAVGKTVGYSSKQGRGDVNFTQYVEWMPTDGILNPSTGGFVIELTSKDYNGDTSYKEWYISKYKLKNEPEQPKPEPNPEPKPPVTEPEEPKPDPKPPVTEPEKPVEPTPNPNPDPTPPVEPEKPEEKPEQPKPPVIDKPDEKPNNPEVKPPVDNKPENPDTGKPEEKPEEKPEVKPEVPKNPFSEQFIQSVSVSIGASKNLFLANFNSVNKRLGDLRGQEVEHGVWGRTFAGGYDNSTFWTLQAGYDNLLIKKDNLSLYVGGALGYARDSITNMVEGVVYVSMIQDSGWYNDTLIKGAYMNSKTPLTNLNHYGFVLSDEVGYRFRINKFFIDPQMELSLGYLTGGSLQDYYNGSIVNMDFSNTFHFRGRAGATFGYEHVMEKNKSKLQTYLGLFGELDKFIGSKNSVSAYGLNQAVTGSYENDARMVLNVGFNYDMLNAGRMYFDFEKSFFGNFTIDWKVNFGYRYAFGEKVKVKTEEKTEAPIKLKEESENASSEKSAKSAKAKKTNKSKVAKAKSKKNKVAKAKAKTKKIASK